jgi:hypothetical protein
MTANHGSVSVRALLLAQISVSSSVSAGSASSFSRIRLIMVHCLGLIFAAPWSLNVPDHAYQERFLPSRQSWIAAVPLEAPSVPAVPDGSVLAIASSADTRSLAWALPPSRATISQVTCGRHYARASRVADAAGQVEAIDDAVRICWLRQRGTLADISSSRHGPVSAAVLSWFGTIGRTAPLCPRCERVKAIRDGRAIRSRPL